MGVMLAACGPSSRVNGDYTYGGGCSFDSFGLVSTFQECDELCQKGTNPKYNACVQGTGSGDCYGIEESIPGVCNGTPTSLTTYQRWRLCDRPGAQPNCLHPHPACSNQ
jgi:hypothetical protein